jgi:hypothetical protein
MAIAPNKLPNMEQHFLEAIHRSIEAAAEAAIQKAKADLETTLREKLMGIGLELAHEVKIQHMRDHIIVTIKDQRKG